MEMPATLWMYRAKPERIIDGDSIVVVLDLGLGVHLGRGNEGAHLRLLGVDTPERNETGWYEARMFVVAWLTDANTGAWPLRVQTAKGDAFNRYLADVWRLTDGAHLNTALIESGHAIVYER